MAIPIDDIQRQCTDIMPLKKGGQKQVFKAKHQRYGDIVIKAGQMDTADAIERIRREVTFLKSIASPYFPKTHEFIIDGNEFVIIEEHIEFLPFNEVQKVFCTERKIVELQKELISGLSILWENNIVHRDLKPDNILITKAHTPKIIDLGIAKFLDAKSLTKTLAFRGPCTPIYAAPEQLVNEKELIGVRTDFFLLGINLLELHLGFHPFSPDKVGAGNSIPENILDGRYIRPGNKAGTSPEFCHLIDKLLMPQPFQRFRTHRILSEYIDAHWS